MRENLLKIVKVLRGEQYWAVIVAGRKVDDHDRDAIFGEEWVTSEIKHDNHVLRAEDVLPQHMRNQLPAPSCVERK